MPGDPDVARGRSLSDRELLAVQMSVHWNIDQERRRHDGRPKVVAACTRDGEMTTTVHSALDDEVAGRLLDTLDRGAPPEPGQPQSMFDACERILRQGTDRLQLAGGPSYHVEQPRQQKESETILRSSSSDARWVLPTRPSNWQPEEWDELISGGDGAPWAMVVEDEQVVSICHTPVRTSMGAEAGTWTDPRYRGRGYAAATTAAWAELMGATCPYLFYSTTIDNQSSQRVAQRLGLRQIGWLWKLISE